MILCARIQAMICCGLAVGWFSCRSRFGQLRKNERIAPWLPNSIQKPSLSLSSPLPQSKFHRADGINIRHDHRCDWLWLARFRLSHKHGKSEVFVGVVWDQDPTGQHIPMPASQSFHRWECLSRNPVQDANHVRYTSNALVVPNPCERKPANLLKRLSSHWFPGILTESVPLKHVAKSNFGFPHGYSLGPVTHTHFFFLSLERTRRERRLRAGGLIRLSTGGQRLGEPSG